LLVRLLIDLGLLIDLAGGFTAFSSGRASLTWENDTISALEQDRGQQWQKVLSALLWVVLAAGGLSLLVALDPILLVVGGWTASGDVTGMVMDKYRIISIRNFGLVAYGVVWLGGVLGLSAFLGRSKTSRQLLTRFGVVVAAEAAVWGLSYIFQEFLLF